MRAPGDTKSITLRTGWLALVACTLLFACQGSSGNHDDTDGNTWADADAGSDVDGGGDQLADAGSDPGADPGSDPGADYGADPGSDPGADAELDAGDQAGDFAVDGDEQFDGGADQGADQGGLELPHGLQWVRTHPMFLSALTVSMGAPPADFVNDYFDGFHANAVHLWQNGLPNEMNGWQAAGNQAFLWVSWTLPDGTSMDGGELAGGFAANPTGRIGYQVSDEPRDMDELIAIQAGCQALRQHDPDALLIVNFSIGADQLDQMLDYYGTSMDADVISYDQYSRANSSYEALQKFRQAGLAQRRPYWRYMNSYMNQDLEFKHSESDQRWDAFSGLVFGYSGHTWFIYQIRGSPDLNPVLFEYHDAFDAPKTEYWAVHAQINTEMRNLGRAITQLTSIDVRYVPTLDFYLPKGLTKWTPGAGGDPYITGIEKAPGELGLEILAGFFTDDVGEIYVMLQNVRHEHGDFPINRTDAGTIRISFDFSSAPPGFDKASVLSLNKLNGQQENVALSLAQADGGYLDLTLAAGDVFLFKYADGVPFALGP